MNLTIGCFASFVLCDKNKKENDNIIAYMFQKSAHIFILKLKFWAGQRATLFWTEVFIPG